MRRSVVCVALVIASILGAAELKIAVIDYNRTLKSYKVYEQIKKELALKEQERQQEIAKHEERLKNAQTELEQFDPGTEEYRDRSLKLYELETLIKVMNRQFALELTAWREKKLDEVMGAVQEEIARYAQAEKIDLVLTKYWVDRKLGVPNVVVLFARPSLDISDRIIERLNGKVTK